MTRNACREEDIPNLHARPSFEIHAETLSQRRQTRMPPTRGIRVRNASERKSRRRILESRFIGYVMFKSTIRLTRKIHDFIRRTPRRREASRGYFILHTVNHTP